ncbi:MAG: pseudouridine synthase [bacterium]|nr:pseudouridine synthase [bacterium]
MERIQKIIANSGIASRRKAEQLIIEGRVKVNGIVVSKLGTLAGKNDVIEVDNIKISNEEKVYFLLNKPRGIVTTASDEFNRKTVVDLISTDKRIYPVGRLDYDTTGLIILTNDGEFTNNIIHPRNNIDKTYIAKINGILNPHDIMQLKHGVFIDGYKTSSAKVKVRKIDNKANTSMIEITIHEGKNHQVKKMFEVLGYKVLKLKRESIAFLTLKGLNSGEYRKLTPKEVNKLYVLSQKKKGNR